MAKNGDETIKKYAKKGVYCLKNTFLPFEFERICFSCGYIRKKKKLNNSKKHNEKKQNVFMD